MTSIMRSLFEATGAPIRIGASSRTGPFGFYSPSSSFSSAASSSSSSSSTSLPDSLLPLFLFFLTSLTSSFSGSGYKGARASSSAS